MKAKAYQRSIWKDVNLKELNKFLKTHDVSAYDIETEIVLNEKILKKDGSKKVWKGDYIQ